MIDMPISLYLNRAHNQRLTLINTLYPHKESRQQLGNLHMIWSTTKSTSLTAKAFKIQHQQGHEVMPGAGTGSDHVTG